jgi:phosphoribosylglycinamide formyltransferase-1
MALRIVVLASGRGSNLRAILDAIDRGAIAARVVAVGSDKPDSGAIALARERGIPVLLHPPSAHPTRAACDAALFADVAAVHPDVIVCAGYMRLIDAAAVRGTQGRMLNIHPSLLPAYRGLRTHARALADGVREHGASVHVVTPELDAGPVLAQATVPVELNDTPDALAAKVLRREHPLLVAVIGSLARGELALASDGTATWRHRPLSRPLRLGDDDTTLLEMD